MGFSRLFSISYGMVPVFFAVAFSGCFSADKFLSHSIFQKQNTPSSQKLSAKEFSNGGLNFNWQDRRPIGELMLAPVTGNGARRDGFAPNNPRGWLNDRSIDITTPNGLVDYQNKILAYADNSISVLQSINAQGGITWDLEGEEYPQDTTYIGDPSLAVSLAPEWESVIQDGTSPYQGMKLIDAYFKKYRDAGLKIGVTLRPQTLEQNNFSDCNNTGDVDHTCQPFSSDQDAQAQNLIRKIEYAKQRWGASIFYVDSNVIADSNWNCWPSLCNNDWTQCPATCPDGNNLKLPDGRSRMGSISLDASVFATVAASEPDVLVIPEHHTDHADATHGDYFKYSSPLYQLFQDYGDNPAHTPDDEVAAVNGAFSAIIINNAGLTVGDQRYQQLVQGVSRGDILIARAWWSQDSDLNLVRSIYQAAVQSAPDPVASATPIPTTSAVRIIAIGDSITAGDGDHASYRWPLWSQMISDGRNIQMVGPFQCGAINCVPNPKAGQIVNGKEFDTHQAAVWGINSWSYGNSVAPNLPAYPADIALMHLGTNDVFDGIPAHTYANYDIIIDRLRAGNPNIVIFLAQIIGAQGPRNDWSNLLNAGISNYAAGRSTAQSPVIVVDQYSGFDPSTQTTDGLHPSPAGEQIMASKWYAAIAPYLNSGSSAPPPAPVSLQTASPPVASPIPVPAPVPSGPVAVAYPLANQTISGVIQVRVTVTVPFDASGVQLPFDGNYVSSLTWVQDKSYRVTLDTSTLTNGSHDFKVSVNDLNKANFFLKCT